MTTKYFSKLMEDLRSGAYIKKSPGWTCGKCMEQKSSDCFYTSQTASWCKACMLKSSKDAAAKRKALDPIAYEQRRSEAKKALRHKDMEKHRETRRASNQRSPDVNRRAVAKATAKFKAEFPDEYTAQCGEKAQRRASAKIQRTPTWSSPEECRVAYRSRIALQKATGIRHAVDHSVPLRGRLVSGLHVPENLVVIPYEANAQKSNKFDPMTYKWWPSCCPKPLHKETIST